MNRSEMESFDSFDITLESSLMFDDPGWDPPIDALVYPHPEEMIQVAQINEQIPEVQAPNPPQMAMQEGHEDPEEARVQDALVHPHPEEMIQVAQINEQIPEVQAPNPPQMAMQEGHEDPEEARVQDPSLGVQDDIQREEEALESPVIAHAVGNNEQPAAMQEDLELQVVQQSDGDDQANGDQNSSLITEQTHDSAPVPEINLSPERSPEEGSAASPHNPPAQQSDEPRTRRRGRRAENFVLPEGWYKEVRVRQSGSSAGNRDTYYIERRTHHICRSKREMMDYIRQKEQERENRRQRRAAIRSAEGV